jgi:hypothetical protein
MVGVVLYICVIDRSCSCKGPVDLVFLLMARMVVCSHALASLIWVVQWPGKGNAPHG